MRKMAGFMAFYSIFLFVPLVSWAAGFLTSKQLGLALPKLIDFLASLVLGLFFIPVVFLPITYTLRRKHLKIHFIENIRKAFLGTIPFLIVGAILEELFFRGFLIGATLSLGMAFSVIVSGILHYFAHFQNPGFQMVENMIDKAVAAIGMLAFTFALAWLFVSTGSVLNTISAHIANSLGFSWLMMRTKINGKFSEFQVIRSNIRSNPK